MVVFKFLTIHSSVDTMKMTHMWVICLPHMEIKTAASEMKIVVQQHRQIHSKHEMKMHSLITYECIMLLHVQNKMQPIQAKFGA